MKMLRRSDTYTINTGAFYAIFWSGGQQAPCTSVPRGTQWIPNLRNYIDNDFSSRADEESTDRNSLREATKEIRDVTNGSLGSVMNWKKIRGLSFCGLLSKPKRNAELLDDEWPTVGENIHDGRIINICLAWTINICSSEYLDHWKTDVNT